MPRASMVFPARHRGFPGQSTNPVGCFNAPGYPGSLTSFSASSVVSGTPTNPSVYKFLDFVNSNAFWNGLHDVIFYGCRFSSNLTSNGYTVELTNCTNISFRYCSFTPLPSFYTAPPGAAWPSAGLGGTTTTQITDVNCINGNDSMSYQVWIAVGCGELLFDHNDFWGFGNAAIGLISGYAGPCFITSNWMHDMCNASPVGYHQDGILGSSSSNIYIYGNTIASIANTNGIAMQQPGPYVNVQAIGNYLSGYGYLVSMGHVETGDANLVFANNIIATDIQCVWGWLFEDYTTRFTSATWYNNRFRVYPGSVWSGNGGFGNFNFTSANNNNYIWPDSSFHTTDY